MTTIPGSMPTAVQMHLRTYGKESFWLSDDSRVNDPCIWFLSLIVCLAVPSDLLSSCSMRSVCTCGVLSAAHRSLYQWAAPLLHCISSQDILSPPQRPALLTTRPPDVLPVSFGRPLSKAINPSPHRGSSSWMGTGFCPSPMRSKP